MGTIDKITFTFTCPSCNTQEEGSVVEYGSTYGGSWGSPPKLLKFSVEWSDGQYGQPRPTSAVCMQCGSAANVQAA
jgi:hypothetical protein